MRRLTLFVVLVAFLFSCGGQWPVLQVVAWANMIREYSQMVPLATAVQMTFSGHYPCALCKALAQKKQSEDNNKIAALVSHEKKLLPAALVMSVPETDNSPLVFWTAQPRLETRSDSPPTPPPRLA